MKLSGNNIQLSHNPDLKVFEQHTHEQVSEEAVIYKKEVQLRILHIVAYPLVALAYSEVHNIVINVIPQDICLTD